MYNFGAMKLTNFDVKMLGFNTYSGTSYTLLVRWTKKINNINHFEFIGVDEVFRI